MKERGGYIVFQMGMNFEFFKQRMFSGMIESSLIPLYIYFANGNNNNGK